MRRMLCLIGGLLLAGPVLAIPAVAQEDGDDDFQGAVELLYRDVSVDGSSRKYEEDFDGLDSGMRLSRFWANWRNIDSKVVDFLRLEASGLGGDPHERVDFRVGRRDFYDLTVKSWRQKYLYDLFESTPDVDGSTWNTDRRMTDVDLTFHATDRIDVFVEFQEVQRDGNSLFMKDINTDLFRLDTPLDQAVKRYSVGGRFRLGAVDLFFRQMLRRYDYRFQNTTEGNPGLSLTDAATLDSYDWRQNDRGDADLTTLTVSAPLGSRVHLTASVFGTLVGKDETTSHVGLDALGTSFRGTCAVTGAFCDAGNPCDAGIPGNVCVGDPYEVTGGVSEARIEADHLVVDADLSVNIVESLDFHLQVRSLEREITGFHLRDLDGDGTADDTEGTGAGSTPGVLTTQNYGLDSITGIFDYAPSSKIRLRAGYRTIDRNLERSGYEPSRSARNVDFSSDSDETILLGLNVKPVRWFHLNADYEEGDITQPFTAVAPMEVDRLRVRARFLPREEVRIDLTYVDHENSNTGADFRVAAECGLSGGTVADGCWNSAIESTTYSASFWHKATPNLDYWFRWAEQELDSAVAVYFDTDFFGIAENGYSVYDRKSTQWAGRVNFSWSPPWKGFARFRINDSTGDDSLVGPTFVNPLVIDQGWSDVEVGVTYAIRAGLYVGGRYRFVDYDDHNDLLDYDGGIFTFVTGLTF